MVLPDSRGIPRAPRYSGLSKRRHIPFVYGTFTHYGPTFQYGSTKHTLCNFSVVRNHNQLTPHNPFSPTRSGFNDEIGLGYCPFAHHYSGNHCCFLFLGVLRCFNSPRYLPTAYVFSWGYPAGGMGYPIRKSPDQSVFATPRGISQLATSFVGNQCQGIHRMPFIS